MNDSVREDNGTTEVRKDTQKTKEGSEVATDLLYTVCTLCTNRNDFCFKFCAFRFGMKPPVLCKKNSVMYPLFSDEYVLIPL